MAGSLNRAMIIGNVGKDPEIRRTQNGAPVANFSVATSETWRDKNTGEKREQTEWHRIVVFNEGLCRVIEQYVQKGSKVMIEGKLQTRKWTDQQGVERYSTEIVLGSFGATLLLLGDRGGGRDSGDDDRSSFGSRNENGSSAARPAARPASRRGELDDDIPF